MTGSLRKTPLFDWHSAHGGRMVDFAGWSMPVQYGSIVAEHQATRQAAGLFDVSHMGRLRIDGPASAAFLDRLLTRQVIGLAPGKVRYSLVCNEAGGILDDVLVYHLAEAGADDAHLLVVNASNREKIWDWLQRHLPSDAQVRLTDVTLETAMIAVQGPQADALVRDSLGVDAGGLSYYSAAAATIANQPAIVSRTGYTGEDGCELVVPAGVAAGVWEKVLSAGQGCGAMAVGLGARDTLRLEAAMPLYGHELSEMINPIQAGLKFAVNLDGREFVGKQAIQSALAAGPAMTRVGLTLAGKRAAREHYPVLSAGKRIGEVTSGTFSPTLQTPIAMAYVEPAFAAVGTEVVVDIRGTAEQASVAKLPFYSRR